MPTTKIKNAILWLLLLFLFFGGLYLAASFLKPLATGLLLAFLFLPVARKLESWKLNRVWASISCLLLALIFFGGIMTLMVYQGKQFTSQYDELKESAVEKYEQTTSIISEKTGISKKKIDAAVKQSGLQKLKDNVQGFLSSMIDSSTSILLMMVYFFTFLLYRNHFKRFMIRLFSEKDRQEVVGVLEESVETALGYLKGKAILILILAVIYSIGLSIIGVKFALLYGILAAVLSIIPYIGNIIGGGLPFLTALLFSNLTSALLVLGLFTLVQFIESYVLQPLVVGKEVELHPMMTIMIVVLAASLWGIAGMVIAIPYLGIVMVLFSHIKGMEPYAFLLKDKQKE